MPSGGQDPVDVDVARYVAMAMQDCAEYGLEIEFLRYFIGGLKAGQDPIEAAMKAAIEWDVW